MPAVDAPPEPASRPALNVVGGSHPVLDVLERCLGDADIPVTHAIADGTWHVVIVEVPPGARRHGAEQCSELTGLLRELVAVQTGSVEVVVLVDAGEHADDRRLAGKFQTVLTRMTAEAQILFGVASTINGIDVSGEVDVPLLCRRLIEYFDQSETLVTGELLVAEDLRQHSIGTLLSNRFA